MGTRRRRFVRKSPPAAERRRYSTAANASMNSCGPVSLEPNTAQIVTMASGTGSLAWNQPGRPGPEGGGLIYYRTSKAGVNMITRNLAIELKSRGITVVALAPGHVRTEMGGPDAPLSIKDSVSGIMRLLDDLTPDHSGSFLLYDGTTYAW